MTGMTESSPANGDDDLNASLRADLAALHLDPLWESKNGLLPRKEQPHIWRWIDMQPTLRQVAALTSPKIIERRVLHLVNPEARTQFDETAAGTITAALQILMPGESARPHRHPMNAIRFIIQSGEGAVTVVNGEPVPMAAGDLILTPGQSWHEHINNSDQPVIWADILDVATHLFYGTQNFEPGPAYDLKPPVDKAMFSVGGILPDIDVGQTHTSPQMRYPGTDAFKALAIAPKSADGIRRIRYANPLTGASALPTLDLTMSELRNGETHGSTRSTASSVCVVVEGEGESMVGDTVIRWSRNDIFTVPRNNVVSHKAVSDRAVVFHVSDRPQYEKLGLLREELITGV